MATTIVCFMVFEPIVLDFFFTRKKRALHDVSYLTRSSSVGESLKYEQRSPFPPPESCQERFLSPLELKVSKLFSADGSRFNIINHSTV